MFSKVLRGEALRSERGRGLFWVGNGGRGLGELANFSGEGKGAHIIDALPLQDAESRAATAGEKLAREERRWSSAREGKKLRESHIYGSVGEKRVRGVRAEYETTIWSEGRASSGRGRNLQGAPNKEPLYRQGGRKRKEKTKTKKIQEKASGGRIHKH